MSKDLLPPWYTPTGYKSGLVLTMYNWSRRQPAFTLPNREGKHGRPHTYALGCRCEDCRRYQRDYRRRWRAGKCT